MPDILDTVTKTARSFVAGAPAPDALSISFEGGSPVHPDAADDPIEHGAPGLPAAGAALDAIVRATVARGVQLNVGGRDASYQHKNDYTEEKLNISQPHRFKSANAYRRVLAHELVHSTQRALGRKGGGLTPLDQMMFQFFGIAPQPYIIEELTAELGSVLLLDSIGELRDDMADQSAAYIASYLKDAEDPDGALSVATKQAKDAVAALLAAGKAAA